MNRPDLRPVDPPAEPDDLAAARGIVLGFVIGLALWGAAAMVLVAAGRLGWLP